MATNELSFVIEGGVPLSGTICTNRSKNGAVALLAASLLNKGTTTLTNVPKIEEVNRLLEVLRSIGVSAEWDDHTLTLTPPERTFTRHYRHRCCGKDAQHPYVHRFSGALV